MSVSDKKATSSKKETSKAISACLRCKQDVKSNEMKRQSPVKLVTTGFTSNVKMFLQTSTS